MSRFNRSVSQGFTLMELMIVVVILGILTMLAYPSYIEQVRTSRRAEAQSALLGLAAAMERHFTANNSYLGAANGGGNTGSPGIYYDQVPQTASGSNVYYNLTISAATGSTFTLRATPVNAQNGDGFLEINHQGAKLWDKNDNNAADANEDTWLRD